MKKIIIALGVMSLVLTGCSLKDFKFKAKEKPITIEEARGKAEKFINENFMSPGQKVTVGEVTEEGGLYKLLVKLDNGREISSFMTKDGKKFFPEAINIDNKNGEQQTATDSESTPPAEITKSDKPTVEAFVMSYCPYGTQIEKGLLPVADLLGDKIDFKIKFVSYAMHGDKEIEENTRQYCIDREQPDKFKAYLKCFLAAGEQEKCLSQVKIDIKKLNNCETAADKEFNIKEEAGAKTGQFPAYNVHKSDNEKYGVQGSPTLVINGQEVQSGRDSASLLASICSAFNSAPSECSQKLSSATPAPGFGEGTATDSAGNAGCGQ